MLALYITCLTAGSVLLAASMFVGDSDVDADIDADVSADVDAGGALDADADASADVATSGSTVDGLSWLFFLKVRFWIFAATFFGLSGIMAMILGTSSTSYGTLLVAVPLGVIAGLAATSIVDYLKREDTGRMKDERATIGLVGAVILPIAPGRRGIVRVRLDGQPIEVTARGAGETVLEVGADAVIVDVVGSEVLVRPAATQISRPATRGESAK